MTEPNPEGRHFAPLGVPTVFISSDPGLLAAAGEAYADSRVEGLPPAPIVTLRFELSDGPDVEGAVDIRVEGPRLSLKGGGVAGWADARTKGGRCIVPGWLAADPEAFAAEVTDTLLLFLLTRSGRTPVHAAGVMAGDAALVLAGPSGSGKSTLALAAAERGLQILSDDTLYIQLQPRLRVWGLGRPVHVFPEDAPRFTPGRRLRGGKLKAVVPLAPSARAKPFADEARLILLERGEALDLQPIDADAAMAGLARLEPGFDLLAADSAEAARALAGCGAWRLRLARDPGAAIDFLCDRLGFGTRAG